MVQPRLVHYANLRLQLVQIPLGAKPKVGSFTKVQRPISVAEQPIGQHALIIFSNTELVLVPDHCDSDSKRDEKA